MERKIKELRACLNEQLNKNFLSGVAMNKPQNPILMVYCGNNIASMDAVILDSMRSVWKNKVEAIQKVRFDGEKFRAFSDDSEIDAFGIGELVDKMQSTDDCFVNVNQTLIFVIHDAKDYDHISDFEKSYKNVKKLTEANGMFSAMVVSIVLLDESAKGMAFAKDIRHFFFNGLNSADYDKEYSKTVILSNRLKNGTLLVNEREKENYKFLGNLFVILNNKMNDGMVPLHTIFASQNAMFVTAAHSVLNRPNKEICDVVLNTMISWLDANISGGGTKSGGEWSIPQILDALKLNNQNYIEYYFGKNIANFLPKENLLRSLPRRDYVGDLLSYSYNQFDRETMGSFRSFYKDYYESKLQNENASVLDAFEKDFEAFIQERIPSDVAIRALTPVNIDHILEAIIIGEPDGNRPVLEYMKQKALYDFWKDAREICEKKLEERRDHANKDHFLVQKIWNCFQNMSFGSENENLSVYYGDLMKNALKDYAGKTMNDALNRDDITEDTILDAIKETIFEIFHQESIFASPLAEELVTRMGTNVDIEQMINSLVSNIQNKMHLRTAVVPKEGMKFVMVNQQQNAKETLLYTHLKNYFKDQPNVRFLNTGDNNAIGLVQLYYCSATSLLTADGAV